MIKKTISSFLMIAFMLAFTTPLTVEASVNSNETLGEFLKTTDDISASYTYPSIKFANNSIGKAVLKAHTPIIIRCEETITTNNIVNGGIVNFSILNDIKDNNNNRILIKSGTPVTAQISFSKNKGMIGRSGELTISDFHTTAVDGSYIPLSGTVSAKPDDKMVVSIVLSVLICPLFLLMKGEEAQLSAGATKTAYTVIETYIDTRNNL